MEFDRNDENIADAGWIAISCCNVMCEFLQAVAPLPQPSPAAGLHTSVGAERRNILMLNRKERYEQAELKPGPQSNFSVKLPQSFAGAVRGSVDDVGSLCLWEHIGAAL